MGCRCGGAKRTATVGGEILGYEYISPSGVSSLQLNGGLYLTYAEARADQRQNGGGTIRTHKQRQSR